METPITLWERFKILYAGEGRELKECYEILKAERFEVGLYNSFKGKYYKQKDKREWDQQHNISRSIRESLGNLHETIVRMGLEILLRERLQLSEKKELSFEEVKGFVKLLGDVFALSGEHPKYNTRQQIGVIHANAEIGWQTAVEILFETLKEIRPIREILEDPSVNRQVVLALEKNTKQVLKGERLLSAAPSVKAEAVDA